MKRIIAAVVLVSLLATFSFAKSPPKSSSKSSAKNSSKVSSENTFKIGIKSLTTMNFYSSDLVNSDDISFGMGWGGGLIANFPLGRQFSINPELNFLWRKIYNEEYPQIYNGVNTEYKKYATELAFSVPIMLQYKAIAGLYVSAGAQFDFPFSSKKKLEIISKNYNFDLCSALEAAGQEQCSASIDRPVVDLGLAFGTGYMFGKSFGLDLKYVLGLTQVDSKENNSSYDQMALSLIWYF